MTSRRRPATTRNVKKTTKAKSAQADLALPNAAELIAYSEITIGMLRPVGCVATAADEDCSHAMLVRRRGEGLFQLLARLDQAIANPSSGVSNQRRRLLQEVVNSDRVAGALLSAAALLILFRLSRRSPDCRTW